MKLDHFAGPEGQRNLVAALMSHEIVGNDEALGRKIAERAQLEEFAPGQVLLKQNASDHHVYLIISGEVAIEVNGKRVAVSGSGVPIGEMALLDPTGGRSASAIAISDSIVARLTSAQFETLADEYPQIWRAIAKELARRVRRLNLRLS